MIKLPEPVLRRLADAGVTSVRSVPGFSVLRRGRDVEARVVASRTEQRVELRATDGSQEVLDGYASVYDVSYPVFGGKDSLFGWDETTIPGMAKRSITRGDPVILNFNHNSLPLASTRAGSLRLTDDPFGLRSVAEPNLDSTFVRDVVSSVRSGDLSQMSFAFEVYRDSWNEDFTERIIQEVGLFDVSIVDIPANPATSIGLVSGTGENDDDEEQAARARRDDELRRALRSAML